MIFEMGIYFRNTEDVEKNAWPFQVWEFKLEHTCELVFPKLGLLRDGPLEKLWEGGGREFSSSMNFFLLCLP